MLTEPLPSNSADQSTQSPLRRAQVPREPRTPRRRSRVKTRGIQRPNYTPTLHGGGTLAREQSKNKEFQVIGLSGQLCSFVGCCSWHVTCLKKAVDAAVGVPVHEQRLFIGTRELHDVDQLHALAEGDITNISLVRRPPAKAALLSRLVRLTSIEFAMEPEEVRSDRDVAFAVVCKNPGWLQFLAKPLRADREVVTAAVTSMPRAIRYASHVLRADRELMLSVVRRVPDLFTFAAAELKGDRDFVLTCMQGEEEEEDRIDFLLSNPWKILDRARTVLSLAAPTLRNDSELRSVAGLGPALGN